MATWRRSPAPYNRQEYRTRGQRLEILPTLWLRPRGCGGCRLVDFAELHIFRIFLERQILRGIGRRSYLSHVELPGCVVLRLVGRRRLCDYLTYRYVLSSRRRRCRGTTAGRGRPAARPEKVPRTRRAATAFLRGEQELDDYLRHSDLNKLFRRVIERGLEKSCARGGATRCECRAA